MPHPDTHSSAAAPGGTWRDKHGTVGSQWSKVRLLSEVLGLASIGVGREDEEVLVPAGSTATVLYVNEEKRLVGVEFGGDVEGNVFGNVSWDQLEIVPLPRLNP